MRSIELARSGASPVFASIERPLPHPGSGQLLLEVAACGVCRTDVQLAHGDLPPRHLPFTPGHQVVGRVVALADDVGGWRLGDRVGAIWLAWACGSCRYCSSGRENLCPRARFTGWDVDGGYATHMLVDAAFAIGLPSCLTDAQAAPLLCGGVIGYRALRLAGLTTGLRLGLYGFGASAHLAIQVAVAAGAIVHVATRSEADRRRALKLGATTVGAYAELPPQPLDAAITFAPAGSVVIDALRAVGPGGKVIVNAIHLDAIPSFDYDLLWMERSIASVANVTRGDAREFLELAARIGIAGDARSYALERAAEAIADAASGTIGAPSAVLLAR